MSEPYAREILRRNVAQICQTIGWNGINSTPLDILMHVLEKYIQTLGTQASRYAQQFNRTDPNLHDLGLVFRDLNVQLSEVAEYSRSVPPIPPPVPIEQFPKHKESNLNFLKPGSHEVVTRPMHVHEHLPPMYPEKERDTPAVAGTVEIRQNGIDNNESINPSCASPEIPVTDSPEKPKEIFKRPIDPVQLPNSKRPRIRLDEEERTREISSVMMTMSGFLSPAREGKLPEARAPTMVTDKNYDKHKTNSHHSSATKVSTLDKGDKKSKKNKSLNGKITKSKRKEKSHKSESSQSKESLWLAKEEKRLKKYPSALVGKIVELEPHTSSKLPVPKVFSTSSKPTTSTSVSKIVKPVIKQEPTDIPDEVSAKVSGEETIPVPRKIPISKSPLVSNPTSADQQSPSDTSLIPEKEIKKEVIDEEEKLASQPDRSKINIFKRISNKSKEDKSTPEVVPSISQSDSMISKPQNIVHDSSNENKVTENTKGKTAETVVNNNDTSAVDLSKEMDLRAHEVINIDDDSMEKNVMPLPRNEPEPSPSIPVDKSLQLPYPKDIPIISPKIKKKHKDKKDKTAKLLKKQQQQLAYEMAKAEAEKASLKSGKSKTSKSGRPKNESEMLQMPPSFPFFPRNLMPGPGLIPNPGLMAGSDFLAGLANNQALRGLQSSNLLTNPFALGSAGPSLIPPTSYLPGSLAPGIPNSLLHNYPHTSRSSSSVKIPPMLRRPSLEVIPVDNNDERGNDKSQMIPREKDRHEKQKSLTIPNILQKHKSKSHKDHKSSLFKMPPVKPDITIELNPPKVEPVRQEVPRDPPKPRTSPPQPIMHPKMTPILEPPKPPIPEASDERSTETTDKKKAHRKEKKEKDGVKMKKKKKEKNKEKKRVKEERQGLKDKIKKEKKEKKEKASSGLVPKLTLKLGSNSNSPMPPSSPDVFKLNIKPVVKKEEDILIKDEPDSREHSRSPELAQISALVTRPPKQKHAKHILTTDQTEVQESSPPSVSSPTRKNRPPSSHSSKYKRILFKPLSKKGHFEDDSVTEESAVPSPGPTEKTSGPLPTPYYVDEHGNKIWVCPACGRPDNGSPMIGCDGCDGWYHWVCVGIVQEPGATEDWFCKSCLAKRTAMVLAGVTSGKKRGRKPKGEKVRDCN